MGGWPVGFAWPSLFSWLRLIVCCILALYQRPIIAFAAPFNFKIVVFGVNFEIENSCAQKLPQKKIHYNIKEVNAILYNKIEKHRSALS